MASGVLTGKSIDEYVVRRHRERTAGHVASRGGERPAFEPAVRLADGLMRLLVEAVELAGAEAEKSCCKCGQCRDLRSIAVDMRGVLRCVGSHLETMLLDPIELDMDNMPRSLRQLAALFAKAEAEGHQ